MCLGGNSRHCCCGAIITHDITAVVLLLVVVVVVRDVILLFCCCGALAELLLEHSVETLLNRREMHILQPCQLLKLLWPHTWHCNATMTSRCCDDRTGDSVLVLATKVSVGALQDQDRHQLYALVNRLQHFLTDCLLRVVVF